METTYRLINDMTADELLAQLGPEPRYQHDIFVSLGGDPHDLNYARLSFLTRELRSRGILVKSSRRRGLWIEEKDRGLR